MNHLGKVIAIRTLVERRITEHSEVVPTRYLSYGFKLPRIYREERRGIIVIRGPHSLVASVMSTVKAYEQK